MARSEMYANGIGVQPVVNKNSQPGFFNSVPNVPSTLSNSGQLMNNVAPALDSAMYIGRDESYNFGIVAPEFADALQSFPSFADLGEHWLSDDRLDSAFTCNGPNGGYISDSMFAQALLGECCLSEQNIFGSGLETERYDGYSPLSASSFDSVQVSDSTFTSGPTTTSSPEYMLDSSRCISDVAMKQIDMLKGVSKKKINRTRKRSVESNKYPCEIRISKKIAQDGKYLRERAWLGTYATPAQAGRALDVGKYFLCAKKKKKFSDPNSEAILSAFKDHLHAQPLAELVEKVTKMAKHYGANGSLPQSLNSL